MITHGLRTFRPSSQRAATRPVRSLARLSAAIALVVLAAGPALAQDAGVGNRHMAPKPMAKTAKILSAPSAGQLLIRAKDRLDRGSKGDAKIALQLFKQAQEAGYTDPHLHFYVAKAYEVLGESDKAAGEYRKFVESMKGEQTEMVQRANERITALTEGQGQAK